MSKKKEKADVWMPLYIGDYLADTTRLTTEQHGAYLLLLMDYWRNGPPPNDDATLAQITRLAPAAWKKARPSVLRFFTPLDGMLHQKRIDHELQACQTRKDAAVNKASLAAKARWDKQSPAAASSDAASMLQAQPGAEPVGMPGALPNGMPGALPEQCPSSSPSPPASEVSGDVNLSSTACEAGHATSHLLNATTGEENSRPVQLRILLRSLGMPVTSNSAEVLEMAQLGVTDQEITETVDVFRQKKPDDKPNARYILSMITTTREKAAKAMTGAGKAPDVRASPAGQWWRAGASAIESMGAEFGVKWRRDRNENFQDFKVRVFKAAGEGPWMEEMLNQLLRDKSDRYAIVHEHFYGHPPIEAQA